MTKQETIIAAIITKLQEITTSTTTTLTGSIDPDGTINVVGVGTLFAQELVIGDTLVVNTESRTVDGITDNTHLTVSAAFTNTGNDTSPDRIRTYLTNIGTNINDYNADVIAEGLAEYVEVRDPEAVFIKKGEEGFLELAHKQILKLELFVMFEKKSISYARKAVADIYKCIGVNKWWFWDNHQIVFHPVKHLLDIQKEDRTISGANVFLEIEFITNEWGLDESV